MDVADKVRDVMLFTVPGLKDDEDDPLVDPDVFMEDDGTAGRFAKAFIWDEIPWMDVGQEVRDLMILAVPDLGCAGDDADFSDPWIPEDGAESCWAEPCPADTEMPVTAETETPEAPVIRMLEAPAAPAMLAMPADVPAEAPGIEAPSGQVASISAPAAIPLIAVPACEPLSTEEVEEMLDQALEETSEPVIEAPAGDEFTVIAPSEEATAVVSDEAHITEDGPLVMFSFGPQEVTGRGWRVCFSF